MYLLAIVDPCLLLSPFGNSIGYSERLSHPDMDCLDFDNIMLLNERDPLFVLFSCNWNLLDLLRKESSY